jgi:CRISPR/Cas system CSM-associated protein Csm3 (group 7 of RAMP superfamily)
MAQVAAMVPGSGMRGRTRRETERRWQTQAAAGGARWVVWLGLVVDGPAGHENREKLIFLWCITVSAVH